MLASTFALRARAGGALARRRGRRASFRMGLRWSTLAGLPRGSCLLPGTRCWLALLAPGLRLPLPLALARAWLILLLVSGCASAPGATAAPTPAPAPPGAPAGHIGGGRSFRPGGHRNQAIETARTAAAGGLVGSSLVLADAVVPFRQPLFERPLDLRFRRPGFFGPDTRPVGPDRIGRGVGVGRFRLYYPFRLEIGHHLGV